MSTLGRYVSALIDAIRAGKRIDAKKHRARVRELRSLLRLPMAADAKALFEALVEHDSQVSVASFTTKSGRATPPRRRSMRS